MFKQFYKKVIAVISMLVFVLTTANVALAQTATPLAEVTGLKIEKTGNQTVTLKWNAVTGATNYKVLYGTLPVGSNAEYNRPPIDAGNTTTYTVQNLTNGTKYYFSVIATNATSTSQFYGTEVSATPNAEGANAAPKIVNTVSTGVNSFNIEFSKPMNFTGLNLASQITAVKSIDESALTINSVSATSDTLLNVSTAPQDPGSEYRITLTDQFKDTAGTSLAVTERSSILIGFADLFGSAEDAGDLKVKAITVLTNKKGIEVEFNQEVQIGENPVSQLAIVETNNPDSSLGVLEVKPNTQDKTKILIITEAQKEVSYTILITGFKDNSGKLISEANSTVEFVGGAGQAGLPQEVTDLAGQFVDIAKIIVNLTWGSSPDFEASDFKGYKVYLSTDGGANFDLLESMLATDTEFTTESLSPAEKYLFKVTAENAVGESKGVITELELPGTGPAGLALLGLSSLAAGRFLTKKRK